MSLPQIVVPEYSLILPSNGKKIKFRPFVMREEKILLIAMESNESSEMTNALKQIVKSCLITDLDVDSMCEFDLEYILLKLRCKSVGEEMKFTMKCKKCKEPNKITVNGDEIEITKNKAHANVIKLTDNVGIVMKYPTIDDSRKKYPDEITNIEKTIDLIASCIESIYDGDEMYSLEDYKQEEIEEFIGNLTQKQFEDIVKFFNTMPELKHTIKYNCSNKDCGEENEFTLEGVEDFFI